jgi:hypothetical protein
VEAVYIHVYLYLIILLVSIMIHYLLCIREVRWIWYHIGVPMSI